MAKAAHALRYDWMCKNCDGCLGDHAKPNKLSSFKAQKLVGMDHTAAEGCKAFVGEFDKRGNRVYTSNR